jgi:hypothetical protein
LHPTSYEDGLWDAAVLGPQFDAFSAWRSGNVNLLLTPRHELPPLQQVLLANAASATARRARAVDVRMIRRCSDSNPLLSRALEVYVSPTHAACVLAAEDTYAWSALDDFYLYSLDERFDEGVSLLLHRVGADSAFDDEPRWWLNALLFHALQNARQHGRTNATAACRSFSGIAARIVNEVTPLTPSVSAWLDAVRPELGGERPRFLELVIHDDGPGVAAHYYDARTAAGIGAIYDRPLADEWTFLNGAFEHHAGIRKLRALGTGGEPVHGLAGMLSAVKRLRGYMELRSGRLRAYRWYRADEAIVNGAQQLLLPGELPAAAPALTGTVVRFFVPLSKG